ncbi:MAG: hypothetical protein D3923_09900 [Candidatus Electrothrix sp. AR3]|nr:hypothetical protein [Candidatus Electrothrix sp. AR3]
MQIGKGVPFNYGNKNSDKRRPPVFALLYSILKRRGFQPKRQIKYSLSRITLQNRGFFYINHFWAEFSVVIETQFEVLSLVGLFFEHQDSES